jgi:hypothetical protein
MVSSVSVRSASHVPAASSVDQSARTPVAEADVAVDALARGGVAQVAQDRLAVGDRVAPRPTAGTSSRGCACRSRSGCPGSGTGPRCRRSSRGPRRSRSWPTGTGAAGGGRRRCPTARADDQDIEVLHGGGLRPCSGAGRRTSLSFRVPSSPKSASRHSSRAVRWCRGRRVEVAAVVVAQLAPQPGRKRRVRSRASCARSVPRR